VESGDNMYNENIHGGVKMKLVLRRHSTLPEFVLFVLPNGELIKTGVHFNIGYLVVGFGLAVFLGWVFVAIHVVASIASILYYACGEPWNGINTRP
jgi:hypothetical protein